MNAIVQGALMSMLPFTELRLAIPLAIAKGANPETAFISCTAANIIIIPLLFLFLNFIHSRLITIKAYSDFMDRLVFKRIRPKGERLRKKIEMYGLPALTLFVAIPLPLTGAYTGTIIAWILGLRQFKSGIAIACGVAIAGIIVTLISAGIITAFNFF